MAALFIYWYLCTELLTLLGGALRIYLINYIDTISSSGLEFVTALESEGGNPDRMVLLNGNVLEIASVLLFPCTRQQQQVTSMTNVLLVYKMGNRGRESFSHLLRAAQLLIV